MVSADSPFLRACRGEPHDHVPVWFMRQAGRSLPEYRAIRGSGSITEAIRNPDLATEITLQPVRRYGTDAAILYSDIVTPLEALGFGVDVKPGVGPVVERPFTSEADLDRIVPFDPEGHTPFVLQTVRNLVAELGDIPLIGFAGAPFTVASYVIEGGPSRTYVKTKNLMYNQPELFATLFADHDVTLTRVDVDRGELPSDLDAVDGWITTGSAHSLVSDDLPWLPGAIELVRTLVREDRPFVGDCFGHQLLAVALGGTVERAEVGR